MNITLPDGKVLAFDSPKTVLEVAESIGTGLARAAIGGKINGKLVDVDVEITHDCELSIITAKNPEGLEIIRHSTAHLLAQAVKQLFPTAQVTIGPVIEDGFYYDFAFGRSFTPEDIILIEKKMKEIAKSGLAIKRTEISRNDAIKKFDAMGEHYKVQIIQEIPEDEILSLYEQGDFVDLCRGPHVPNTKKLGAFKLTKIAGAYWRGDSKNEMLQRIYGTAWATKDDLKEYLHRIKEAEKRDHRKIAKAQDLFHLQEEAPGMVFWHPKGWNIYLTLQSHLRKILEEQGYNEIRTPIMADRTLWEKSGHWDKFQHEMFTTASENRDYAIKPMNCPCHVQVFNQGRKSYRDLPLRLSEYGSCHRDEPSGTLHGLMRVRNLVQDDAHIFCTEEQIQSEVARFIDLLFKVYKDFGFTELLIKLSTRPDERVGGDDIWDKAELALENALNNKELDWELSPGEGAFYGPKIEFSLKDCLGRVWQCGTMQVDFSMPGRLDASYIDENGNKAVPVMLHRAIYGSFERFIGILIEHFAGVFPVWLAPLQVAVLNISENQSQYCEKIAKKLQESGIRAHFDLRNEKVGFKIRHHTLQRVPYQLVIGDKEVAAETVAVRTLSGEDMGTMPISAFIEKIQQDIADKRHIPLEGEH